MTQLCSVVFGSLHAYLTLLLVMLILPAGLLLPPGELCCTALHVGTAEQSWSRCGRSGAMLALNTTVLENRLTGP